MNNTDGRVAVIANAARASSANDDVTTGSASATARPMEAAPYVWHVMVQDNGLAEVHALTVGDPYPIVVATVAQLDTGSWLVTAHQHLDPNRHQRSHARTLAQAKKVAEVLASAECARLSNLRRYRRKQLRDD